MKYAVIYISRAKPDLKLGDIITMLEKAKRFNRGHAISGCIVYHKGAFIQLIEGEEKEVRALYKKIRKDSRHYRVTTLYEGPLQELLFEEWAMIFYEFSGKQPALTYKRLLFENYLQTAWVNPDNAKVFEIFRDSCHTLLSPTYADIRDVVEQTFKYRDREGGESSLEDKN